MFLSLPLTSPLHPHSSSLIPPNPSHPSPLTSHLSPLTSHLSPINYQLSTINYQLSTINYQLSPTTYHLSPLPSPLSPLPSLRSPLSAPLFHLPQLSTKIRFLGDVAITNALVVRRLPSATSYHIRPSHIIARVTPADLARGSLEVFPISNEI